MIQYTSDLNLITLGGHIDLWPIKLTIKILTFYLIKY